MTALFYDELKISSKSSKGQKKLIEPILILVITILNFAPAAKDFNTELLSYTDYLILNEVEAEQLSHLPCQSLDEVKASSLYLLTKYAVKKGVIITLGGNGVLYTDAVSKSHIHCATSPVKAVDTSVTNKTAFTK